LEEITYPEEASYDSDLFESDRFLTLLALLDLLTEEGRFASFLKDE